MRLTRAQNVAAFAYVLKSILDQDTQDPLALALALIDADVKTINSLISLSKASIDALMFERPLAGSTPLQQNASPSKSGTRTSFIGFCAGPLRSITPIRKFP